MAERKTQASRKSGATRKTAARKTSSTSRSRAASTRRGSSAGPEQNAQTASDNAEATDRAVNEIASEQAAAASAATGDGTRPAKLHPEVEKHLLGNADGEPLSSINSVPKAEGGMPADVIATIRSNLDSVRGEAALGQPGQEGHGVGTGTAGLQGTLDDDAREANEKEYAARFR